MIQRIAIQTLLGTFLHCETNGLESVQIFRLILSISNLSVNEFSKN